MAVNVWNVAEIDKITKEMIKSGGECVIEWIWKICCIPFKNGTIREDWKGAVIVFQYKGKDDKGKCKNYTGYSY